MTSELQCTGGCCEDLTFAWHRLSEEDLNQINGLMELVEESDIPNKSIYRCTAFNTETRLCEIYLDRPDICREYPVKKQRCSICGMIGPFNEEPPPPSMVSPFIR